MAYGPSAGFYHQRGPCAMTECQIFSRPARPNSVNKHFIIWPPRYSFFFFYFWGGEGGGNQIRNEPLRSSFWPKSRDLYSNKVTVLVRISRALLIKSSYEGRTRAQHSRAAFSGPASAIAYGPHTWIFSIVLRWKCARGRTGHMIMSFFDWRFKSALQGS